MTGLEIFTKIKNNNKRIKELSCGSTFVLNPEIQALKKENFDLRSECPHNFLGGVCEFCGKEEDK